MSEISKPNTQPVPDKDLPGVAPGATKVSVLEGIGAKAPAEEGHARDRDRRNPKTEGSTYGFGTPAQGFGRKNRTDPAGSA